MIQEGLITAKRNGKEMRFELFIARKQGDIIQITKKGKEMLRKAIPMTQLTVEQEIRKYDPDAERLEKKKIEKEKEILCIKILNNYIDQKGVKSKGLLVALSDLITSIKNTVGHENEYVIGGEVDVIITSSNLDNYLNGLDALSKKIESYSEEVEAVQALESLFESSSTNNSVFFGFVDGKLYEINALTTEQKGITIVFDNKRYNFTDPFSANNYLLECGIPIPPDFGSYFQQ
jgi:hypothetical protein